ncbi:MAG: LPS export ABC transporter ATP-binding protein [Longimicrobiales bacterium]|nr:LPS export ABC transporter ATP-binding protein [Longimicrobiales bacterium]
MKTRQELLGFLTDLPGSDVDSAVAAAEVFRRANREGVVERDGWGGPAPGGGAGGGSTSRQALERIAAAGVVSLHPEEGPWERIRIDPDLWEEVRGERETVLQEIRQTIQDLRREEAHEVSGAFAPEERGSRLWAQGLTKIYRKRKVVNDVAISVNQGEIVGLLGPNGAGKTTTFYMIVGLIPPNEGHVHLDDRDITKVPMYKRARMGIGYLAQEPSVFRKLTVEENVLAILETLDVPKKEKRELLDGLLEELSIAHLRDSMAYSLSGGERRRLEITRALVQRPRFMLLDEPFAGIDPIATNDIQHIVEELKHRSIGVIISDHNVEQTLDIVDRAYIMYEGRIRVGGTVSELVWNDEVAEIYLGPTLTERMRLRYERPTATAGATTSESATSGPAGAG